MNSYNILAWVGSIDDHKIIERNSRIVSHIQSVRWKVRREGYTWGRCEGIEHTYLGEVNQ